jgi:putative N-acetylmannosamine-6-phosphate epimerase
MDIRVLPEVTDEEILTALKAAEIKGLTVTEVYEAKSKLTEITDAAYRLRFHSPKASPDYARAIEERFKTPVIMMKKSKSGEKEVDITSLIRSLTASFEETSGTVVVDCTLACSSSEYLNPSYVADAIARETDMITDDTWHETERLSLLRADGTEFR